MTVPIDFVDEIDKLLAAFTRTQNLVYLAEARVRIDVARERFTRCCDAVAAVEAEVVLEEGSR